MMHLSRCNDEIEFDRRLDHANNSLRFVRIDLMYKLSQMV